MVSIGRIFLAVGLIAIGCQHFFFGQFVPMVVPLWSARIPGRWFWVYLVRAVLIVGGVAVISGIKARPAATLLAGFFLLSLCAAAHTRKADGGRDAARRMDGCLQGFLIGRLCVGRGGDVSGEGREWTKNPDRMG